MYVMYDCTVLPSNILFCTVLSCTAFHTYSLHQFQTSILMSLFSHYFTITNKEIEQTKQWKLFFVCPVIILTSPLRPEGYFQFEWSRWVCMECSTWQYNTIQYSTLEGSTVQSYTTYISTILFQQTIITIWKRGNIGHFGWSIFDDLSSSFKSNFCI